MCHGMWHLPCPWSFETSYLFSLHPDIPFCAQSIHLTKVRLIFKNTQLFLCYSLFTDQPDFPVRSFQCSEACLWSSSVTWPSLEGWSCSHRHPFTTSGLSTLTFYQSYSFLSLCHCSCCSILPSSNQIPPVLGPNQAPSFSEALFNIAPVQIPLFFKTHSFYTLPLTLIVSALYYAANYMRHSSINDIQSGPDQKPGSRSGTFCNHSTSYFYQFSLSCVLNPSLSICLYCPCQSTLHFSLG